MASSSRIAFITGSGRRLGRQLAFALAGKGYDVILHANASIAGMEETADTLRAEGHTVFTVQGDLQNVEEIRRIGREIASFTPKLDLLVNNAGIFPTANFDDVTPELWDETQNVNCRSYFFMTQSCIGLLREAGGCVVNIASAGGYEPWNSHIPYNVSKAGVIMLTRGMAKALAPAVRVNAVAPGIIIVPGEEVIDHIPASRFPMQRYGTPKDLADAVLFLAEGTAYITGHVLPVTGGSVAV
ncbi:SDR family oxidoreductase [bacterium]|nr:SDR family oxidoreductase [bacterium]